MNTETKKSTVEQLIAAYSGAVNKGDREAISAFYTEDGLLIPEGFKPVLRGKSDGKYFEKVTININFSISDIVIEGSYAFVEARANTKLTDLVSNLERNKITRDVFILRKKEDNWKIYRYIFNSENAA